MKQLLYDVTWYDRMKTEPCSNVASSHIHHSTFTTQTCDLSLKESALRGGSSKKTTDENGSDENAHKSIMKVIKWIWTGIYCLWQAILVTSDLLKKKKKWRKTRSRSLSKPLDYLSPRPQAPEREPKTPSFNQRVGVWLTFWTESKKKTFQKSFFVSSSLEATFLRWFEIFVFWMMGVKRENGGKRWNTAWLQIHKSLDALTIHCSTVRMYF